MAKNKSEEVERTGFGRLLQKAKEFVPNLAGEVYDVVVRGESPIKAVGDLIKGIKGEVEDPNSALSPDQKLELQRLQFEAEQNQREYELEIRRIRNDVYKLEVEDRGSAREMYKVKNDVSDRIAMRIINWNLVLIFLGVTGEVACIIYLRDLPEIGMVVTSAVGTLVGALIQERQQVIGFFFGSSIGSKIKTMISGSKSPE